MSTRIFIFAIQKHKVTDMVAFRFPHAKIHILFHPTKYFDDKTLKKHILLELVREFWRILCVFPFFM